MGRVNASQHEPAVSVTPADCAFCLAIPADRDAFERVADPHRYDYVPQWLMRLRDRRSPLEAAWECYCCAQVPQQLGALCRTLSEMGAEVVKNAGMEDLARCLGSKRAVLLWAHWSSQRFEPQAVLDPEGIVELAESRSHWLLNEVRRVLRRGTAPVWLPPLRPYSFLSRGREYAQAFIAARFNKLIGRTDQYRERLLQKETRTFLSDRLPRIGTGPPDVTRVLLEYKLIPAVEAARPLELSDGMHTAWEVLDDAIPDERDVVFDLTACNTTELAEPIRLVRRRCRTIAPFHKTDIQTGVLLVSTVFRMLSEHPRPYLEAYVEALEYLKQVLRESYERS